MPGAYRVHETTAPPNTSAGPDVGVTVVKSTSSNPAIVDYINNVGALDINLVKSGPTLAHVGDTFSYTFDATTNGPRLHNIKLEELAPNRCTTAISAKTGDTNSNGSLETGETWHWTCTHTVTSGDPNPLPNTAKVTGTDDFGRSVNATDDHSVIIIHPSIKVEKSGPASSHEGDKVTYTFKVTNTGDVALNDVSLNDDKLAGYIHNNAFNTIVGEVRFNELGEWATARMLLVQFQNVQGSGLDQYMTGHKQVILYPPEYKDGELEAPFAK